MKTRRYLAVLLALSTAAGAWAVDLLTASLQKGLFEEEANHNLEAAIQAYRSAIVLGDDQRKLTATAVFRLGECFRKQGKKAEAEAEYRRVLRDFSDQEDLLKPTRDMLASLGVAVGNESAIPVETEAEAAELARTQALVKSSPDLIDALDEKGVTLLQKAADDGRLTVAEFLLGHGADIERASGSGDTALHHAAAHGRRAMVEFLLGRKARIDAKDRMGNTALFDAAGNGFLAVAKLLLEHGAKAGQVNAGGVTPLHRAAANNQAALVELLLKHGASVDALTRAGESPLHQAAEKDSVDAAEVLVRAGADVNLPPPPLGSRSSMLLRSVRALRVPLVQLLATNRADLNQAFLTPGATGNRQVAPLRAAVEMGSREIVDVLLRAGADVNQPDSFGSQPLHAAVAIGNVPIAELLLGKGAEVDSVGRYVVANDSPGTAQYYQYTPLQLAVKLGNRDMAALLLDHHADPNLLRQPTIPGLNEVSTTPLQAAVLRRDPELVKLLLARGARVDQLNEQGDTALAFAEELSQEQGHKGRVAEEIAKRLREHGATEDAGRAIKITVSRKSRSYSQPILLRDANGLNRLTVAEALLFAFSPQSPAANSLAFPDLEHVVINRRADKDGGRRDLPWNIGSTTQAGDKGIRWLEWGDVLEIPELDHRLDEYWPGLTDSVREAFKDEWERTVSVVVKGETNRLTLSASGDPRQQRRLGSAAFQVPPPFVRPTAGEDDLAASLASGRVAKPLYFGSAAPAVRARPGVRPPTGVTESGEIPSFWLSKVVKTSGLLRTSSDTTRIKVTRVDPGTHESRVWTYDLEGLEDSWNDLWLREGDVIEIPEKQ